MPSSLIVVIALGVIFGLISLGDLLLGRNVQALLGALFLVAALASIVILVVGALGRSSTSSPVAPRAGDTLTVTYGREGLVLHWAEERREFPYWAMGRVSRRVGLVRIRQVQSDRSIYPPSAIASPDDVVEVRRRIVWWRERPTLRQRSASI